MEWVGNGFEGAKKYLQVAVGDVDMALGTDTAGSTRLPACWCGIVGLKATFGLVPITGVIPMDTYLDHVGPMTRTVHDCALLLEVSYCSNVTSLISHLIAI